MNLPPFVYAKAFWNAISLILAGVLALLVFFGVIPAIYALPAGAIYSFIVAVLQFFNINPQLKERARRLAAEESWDGEYRWL